MMAHICRWYLWSPVLFGKHIFSNTSAEEHQEVGIESQSRAQSIVTVLTLRQASVKAVMIVMLYTAYTYKKQILILY